MGAGPTASNDGVSNRDGYSEVLMPVHPIASTVALLLRRTVPSAAVVVASSVAGACDGARPSEPPRRTARAELRIGSVDDSATALTAFRLLVVGRDGSIYTYHPSEATIR